MHCVICLNTRKGHSEGMCKVCGSLQGVNGYQVCVSHVELMSAHTSIVKAIAAVKRQSKNAV